MTPPHAISPRSQRYDRNREIWVLSNKAHFTYNKIHDVTGVPKSTIRKVVRRAKMPEGSTRCSTVWKATESKKIDILAEDHSRVSFERFAHLADCSIGKDTVNQTLHNLGYKLLVPQTKPFLTPWQKQKQLTWCLKYRYWWLEHWKRVCWTNEAKVEFSVIESGRRIRCKAGQELWEDLLAPCHDVSSQDERV